jgi:hypothetical protein
MRRALVIFLVLLFPLNVFALSLSVATMPAAALAQAADAKERVHAPAALADSDLRAISGCDDACNDPATSTRTSRRPAPTSTTLSATPAACIAPACPAHRPRCTTPRPAAIPFRLP